MSMLNVMLISTLLVLFLIPAIVAGEINEFYFIQHPVCVSLANLTSQGCLESISTRSNLECFSKCATNASCLGVIRNANETCAVLKLCSLSLHGDSCDGTSQSHVVASRKMCHNKGTFSKSPERGCQCKRGWIGPYCQTRGQSCLELKDAGYYGMKHVLLEINGVIRKITCRIQGNVNFLILSTNGKYNRNLSWSDYRDGYKIDGRNYWVGLDILHLFTKKTNQKSQLEVVLWLTSTSGSTYLHVSLYENFRVADESHGFSFDYESSSEHISNLNHIESYSKTGFCLQDTLKNVPFSTSDNDRDGDPNVNCAERALSGWWFNGCDTLTCNPMGMSLQSLPPNATSGYMIWPGCDMTNNVFSNFKFNMQFWYRYL